MSALDIRPAHEHAAAISALSAAHDPIGGVLQRAGARRGWWPTGGRWRRTHARVDPGSAPWCTLLYETCAGPQRLCVVELYDTRREVGGRDSLVLTHETFGWVRVERFPCDPGLPTLPDVIARAAASRVVRYRPRRRCTLVLGGNARAPIRYGKVFSDDRGARLHVESVALREASRTGSLGFVVAEPIAWDPQLRLLTQGLVAGVPVVDALHGRQGAEVAARMGAACATLASSALRPIERHDGCAQLARSARYAAELSARAPELSEDVGGLIERLGQVHRAAGERTLRPIHGAPHAHQWLDGHDGLGLVDFDRHGLGDPELDVATFVMETDFEDRARVDVDNVNRAFVEAYESVAGSLDRALLAAYRAHKALAKALKAARQPRLDATAKAARNLRVAQHCLRELA